MNGTKLTIPQIADELKDRTNESPDQVYFIDYKQLVELSGWTREDMDDYRRGRKTFWDDITAVCEVIHVSIYFGWHRVLSETYEVEASTD